jgi:hypothetical protein
MHSAFITTELRYPAGKRVVLKVWNNKTPQLKSKADKENINILLIISFKVKQRNSFTKLDLNLDTLCPLNTTIFSGLKYYFC